MEKPDDRLKKPDAGDGEDPDPKIYLVVNNQKFLRPGLETFFAKPGSGTASNSAHVTCSCDPVGGVYCSCNKVCTCNPLCSCQGYKSCSCQGHSSGGGTYCSCVPVH